jgi:hypothetical protein
LWLLALATATGWAQVPAAGGAPGGQVEGTAAINAKSAEKLYLELAGVGLDATRVYRARDVSFNRAAVHITLQDGTIAFTQDVEGRVTGAFFEGEGEILLMPPDKVERASMALFTGAAILEETFATAYFRFNDDTFDELRPSLSPADNPKEFLTQWNETARNLATTDALRLLMSFSQFLPVAGDARESAGSRPFSGDDRVLHARVQGRKLGVFDVYFDSLLAEQIRAGQPRDVEGQAYYDDWTSFPVQERAKPTEKEATTTAEGFADAINISRYKIRSVVTPPNELAADAVLQVDVGQRGGGQRALLFELSRSLHIERVDANGTAIEFIHNPAIEGTDLARRGDDLVAVILPEPLRAGQRLELRFVYRGQVLSEAGGGLLYVGARGTWYPNRGPAMSDFDLEFRYPAGWTLVATGKLQETISPVSGERREAVIVPAGEQVTRWVSGRHIPLAGFNLGKYTKAVAHAGDVTVNAYAATSMESGFPQGAQDSGIGKMPSPQMAREQPMMISPGAPSPARSAPQVADFAAHAIEFFAPRFGPYPYDSLSLTQMPGVVSQGWPGLIFLSSFAFLTPQEKMDLRMGSLARTITHGVIAHETAHQWWGDLLGWSSYRDQWIVEGLAEYSSLMMLESENPAQFHAVLDKYRADLLYKGQNGVPEMAAGPVTMGVRLSNSQFPEGYEAISYGRGTWLFHMLRTMMRDAEARSGKHHRVAAGATDEPFVRALRKLRERYEGKSVTTRDLLRVFEDELSPSLSYEGKKSLDWFYESWVNGTAIPRLELTGLKYLDKPGSTVVSGTILQKDSPDDLVTSVPLYVIVAGKSVTLGRVFADGPETEFHLTAPAGARKAILDPNQTLLTRPR